jgi:SAM-dependent methyltransferase
MCRRIFQRFLSAPPRSIIDIGCGTGRDLNSLSHTVPDCVGVDALPGMIDFARSRFPHILFHVSDMRSVRLQRTFDAVICMGSVFMYALTNADVDSTLDTFASHATEGTLLILDMDNAATYLPGSTFKNAVEFTVDHPEFSARANSVYTFDRRRQRVVRHRTWTIGGGSTVEDYCEYRLFFPAELQHRLELKGFVTVGMFDNMELRDTDLSGKRLYVAAKYVA